MQEYVLEELPTPADIRSISKSLLEGNFLTLSNYYNAGVLKKIQYILNKTKVEYYYESYRSAIQTLMDVIARKVETMPHYSLIYPWLDNFKKRYQKFIQYRSNPKKIKVIDQEADILVQHFIRELRTRKNRNTFYQGTQAEQKLKISEYISQAEVYFPRSNWSSELYSALTELYKNEVYDEEISIKENINLYNQNLLHEGFMNLVCLGCTQYFYQNQNISQVYLNKTQLVIIKKSQKIVDEQQFIKKSICSLLNSKGGVILFDFELEFLSVLPKGTIFSLDSKAELELKIQKILDFIYPLPKIGKQIVISFVPVKENPNRLYTSKQIKSLADSKEWINGRQNIKGNFIFRIKVSPIYGEKVYYLITKKAENKKIIENTQKKQKDQDIQQDEIQFLQRKLLRQPGKDRNNIILGQNIYNLMKETFQNYYIPTRYSQFQRESIQQIRSIFKNIHDNSCEECELPIEGEFVQNMISQNDKEAQPKRQYKYMSIIVARHVDHQKIKERLADRKIDSQIEVKFMKYQLRNVGSSAMLHHDMKFQLLLAEVAYNKDFQFNGKYILIIPIQQYIKLTERNKNNPLPEKRFDNLAAQFFKQFPEEVLKLYSFQTQNKQIEQYVRTESKMSTAFMYFILNHLNQKSLIKNPKNLEKLTEVERQKRFSLIYSKAKIIVN